MPLLAAPSTPPTNTWASASLDAALENEINDAVRATIAKVMKDATDASSDDSSDVADTLEQLRGLIYGLEWFHDLLSSTCRGSRGPPDFCAWFALASGQRADASKLCISCSVGFSDCPTGGFLEYPLHYVAEQKPSADTRYKIQDTRY